MLRLWFRQCCSRQLFATTQHDIIRLQGCGTASQPVTPPAECLPPVWYMTGTLGACGNCLRAYVQELLDIVTVTRGGKDYKAAPRCHATWLPPAER